MCILKCLRRADPQGCIHSYTSLGVGGQHFKHSTGSTGRIPGKSNTVWHAEVNHISRRLWWGDCRGHMPFEYILDLCLSCPMERRKWLLQKCSYKLYKQLKLIQFQPFDEPETHGYFQSLSFTPSQFQKQSNIK